MYVLVTVSGKGMISHEKQEVLGSIRFVSVLKGSRSCAVRGSVRFFVDLVMELHLETRQVPGGTWLELEASGWEQVAAGG